MTRGPMPVSHCVGTASCPETCRLHRLQLVGVEIAIAQINFVEEDHVRRLATDILLDCRFSLGRRIRKRRGAAALRSGMWPRVGCGESKQLKHLVGRMD